VGLRGESVQWRKKVQEKMEGLLLGGLICLGGCFWWWCGWCWAVFMVVEEVAVRKRVGFDIGARGGVWDRVLKERQKSHVT